MDTNSPDSHIASAPELRFGKIPCRQIPLNASGETLDSLYRYGDDHEIEDKLRNWLRTTIAQLEAQRSVRHYDGGESRSSVEAIKGTPLHQNLHSKCANPACPTAFHWLQGGKFFRFRPGEAIEKSSNQAADIK